MTLDDLRRFAVARTFLEPTSLTRAIERLGFVQADPIRAPARAQDLTLRHRVRGYRAGDLERRYEDLDVEEDFFVNYGFMPRPVQALMQPRGLQRGWTGIRSKKKVQALLEFVRERGPVHPRAVDRHFAHGRVTNFWGGSSSATTHLLEAMHYAGLLRVVRRESGIRIYAAAAFEPSAGDRAGRRSRIDALVDIVVGKYAPLPVGSLSTLVSRLRYAVPQWRTELRAALARAKARLAHARVEGVEWYWPEGENVLDGAPHDRVRFLAPFDPLVWDRRRFQFLWGWAYRFEAYTPPAKRRLGYYALPMLWRDRVIGWANLSVEGQALQPTFGYVNGGPPAEGPFERELQAELERMRRFLDLPSKR